jgi:hypothetical protein
MLLGSGLLLWVGSCLGFGALASGPQGAQNGAQLSAVALAGSGLIQNQGQWPAGIVFAAESESLRVRAEVGGIGLDLVGQEGPGSERSGAHLWLEFVGGRPVVPLGEGQLETQRHYYSGADPEQWVSGVPEFQSVRWPEVWPGIEVRLVQCEGLWAYDLLAEPGADLGEIRFELRGAESLALDAARGELVAALGFGELRQTKPLLWSEDSNSQRTEVSGGFRLLPEGGFGFELEGPRGPGRLVIDPGFDFSTYLGGFKEDELNRVVVDDLDRIVFAGSTWSPDFPSVPGPFPYVANQDAVVGRIRLEPSPVLEFVAYLAGTGYDRAFALTLGPNGRIYAGGDTDSGNFPVTPGAVDTDFGLQNKSDGWVTCLRSDGSSLFYSTFVGGHQFQEQIFAIAVDALGSAVAVGRSGSNDFPTTPGAYQTSTDNTTFEGIVVRYAPDGKSLVYSTLLGVPQVWEEFRGVVLDSEGNAYVTGGFVGETFPVTPGVFKTGVYGGAICKLDPTGSTLLASTWIGGGEPGETRFTDLCWGPEGNLHLCGFTTAVDFPITHGAFDSTIFPGSDREVVVLEVTPDLAQLVRSTFLGANPQCCNLTQLATGIAVDQGGVVTITGYTDGTTAFAVQSTPGSAQPSAPGGGIKAFVARLTPDLTRLLYGSFIGPGSYATGVGLFDDGRAVFTGYTFSGVQLPLTPDALQSVFKGVSDSYITVMDMLPFGAERYGESTPACGAEIWIGVTEQPKAGSSSFALIASGAPPSAVGFLGLSAGPSPLPLPLLGVGVLLDLSTLAALLPVQSDAVGWAEFPLLLPAASLGKSACFQFLWLNTSACGGLGSFSSSSALELTVQ